MSDNSNETGFNYTASPNAVDLSPEQDGGILKDIIKEPTSQDGPFNGEKVSVHYVGRLLDGTIFDSSRERQEPFEFTLGKGEVIKGWDVGVAAMKKGEVSMLTCKPEYAYGEHGSPPKIPPNSTLLFEVELLSWKLEDISRKTDESVLRRVLTPGEGFKTPNDGATVTVKIIGKHGDRVFDDRELTFELGDGIDHNIPLGLERAIEKAKQGEVSTISLKPKAAFGSEGHKEFGVPPNAEVEYELHLKSFEKAKDGWEMDLEEKLQQSEIAKNKGTERYKAGKVQLAMKFYKKVITYLEEESEIKEEEKSKKRDELLVAAQLNLAQCYLKVNNEIECINCCDKALKVDDRNEKGVFRRGMAKLQLNDFDLAKEDFQKVIQINPANKAAQNQLIVCNNKIREHLEKEKATYKKMFGGYTKPTPKPTENGEQEKSKDENITSSGDTKDSNTFEEVAV